MPPKWFICPDGKQFPIEQCLDTCRNPEGRCMALGNLIAAGQHREWTGKPSTTQLLKGTRQAYLEITCDYAIDPDDMAFALLGVWHHRRLESITSQLEGLTEQKLKGEVTGILDRLEPDELYPGKFKLIDYKTWGSYAVAKATGLKNNNEEPDMQDTELQINHYRLLVERDEVLASLFPISRMFIQVTVRDGGTFSAKNNKVFKKMPLIPARKMEDAFVETYFLEKGQALLTALSTYELPDMCAYTERWGGRRCKGYCPVAEYCPEGAAMNRITLKEIPDVQTIQQHTEKK